MKVASESIADVLSKNNTSFFIPPFQRGYSWGKNEIERYFSDISRIIDSELDVEQKDKQEHFFGTLVVKNSPKGFGNQSIIIDGQQRLTTTLLFLIAVRDIENNGENVSSYITNSFLLNPNSTLEEKIKLKQVTKDWNAYKDLINKKDPIGGKITDAYKIFKSLIGKKTYTVQDYLTAIGRINVAIIFLDERPHKGEDPQIIFETLNSLGKPLTLSDLIRNYVLIGFEPNEQDKVYEQIWYPKIETLLGESTSIFFVDYLQYKISKPLKKVSDSNTKELYQVFKDFINSPDNNTQNGITHKNELISELPVFAKIYKWIIDSEQIQDTISAHSGNDSTIKELLINIFHDIKSEPFKPFVLGMLKSHQAKDTNISDDILINSLKTIRTYLIRRRVLNLTLGENITIPLLCKEISKINAETTLLDLLCKQQRSLRLPNDDEIIKHLTDLPLFAERKEYVKFILGMINNNNTKIKINFRNKNISIEHIMPQTLTNVWQEQLGLDFAQIHQQYIHNIGNLALSEHNSELSNKSLEGKQYISEHSALVFYRKIVTSSATWGVKDIERNRDEMIGEFLKVFPLPDKYKHNNNWEEKESNINHSVESLYNLTTSDLRHSKPQSLILEGGAQKYTISNWREVFLYFLNYLYDNHNCKFQKIRDNRIELFGEIVPAIITKEEFDALQVVEKNNKNNQGRYRPLSSISNNLRSPGKDETYIYVHFSAQDCVNRMVKIADFIDIDRDSISIKF